MKDHLLSMLPRPKDIALFAGGVAISAAVVATAQSMANSSVLDSGGCPPDCPLCEATQNAVNKKIQLIAMTSPDPGKYFSAGSSDSCLGDLSLANLDLSRLIPDPIGLMTDAVTGAIDKLKDMAIKKVCSAVRNSVGEVIGKYNNAINEINGGLNVGGLIDTKIGEMSRQAMEGYAMNWQTAGKITDPLAGVRAPTVAVSQVQIPLGTLSALPSSPSVASPVQTQQSTTPAPTAGGAVFGR